MANKALFQSIAGRLLPNADTLNNAMAPAYEFSPRHKLAQLTATGCLNGTFYASAEEQLDDVLQLTENVDAEFIAKTAIYARKQGHMKDMPALFAASLSVNAPEYLAAVFCNVIDNGKMLRNFVQIMRSGVIGRKSLGSRPKALVQHWLNTASDKMLINAMVGQSPSLADVIKMVHPKPANKSREALFGYIIGKDYDEKLLPEELRKFEAFKAGRTKEIPNVPFQMLTALDLDQTAWSEIARNAGWQMLRMNLNSFSRHKVFEDEELTNHVAERLRDPDEIKKSRVLPYQLMVAYSNLSGNVPGIIRDALQDALEIANENVPEIAGNIVICPDVSGSMMWPVTGYRHGASSSVTCIDVAALMSAALLHKNRKAKVMPFDTHVHDVNVNPRDSIMTNAKLLASFGGGGTNCSLPLEKLNDENAKVDLVIMVSDNESWVDRHRWSGTGVMRQWEILKKRNPNAKLVCVDILPYGTSQAQEKEDVLNIGGFSDNVFKVISAFVENGLNADHWIGEIEKIEL